MSDRAVRDIVGVMGCFIVGLDGSLGGWARPSIRGMGRLLEAGPVGTAGNVPPGQDGALLDGGACRLRGVKELLSWWGPVGMRSGLSPGMRFTWRMWCKGRSIFAL